MDCKNQGWVQGGDWLPSIEVSRTPRKKSGAERRQAVAREGVALEIDWFRMEGEPNADGPLTVSVRHLTFRLGPVVPLKWRVTRSRRAACRICRFFQSRQFTQVEKGDRPSETAKIAQNAHSLLPNQVSAWSAAFRRVSYCVNGSLLRPWGNSCLIGNRNADAAVGG
jgi:hypothetical protein